jgi:hypothetical protein
MNAEAYIFYLQQQAAHGYIGYDQIYSPWSYYLGKIRGFTLTFFGIEIIN